MNPETVKNYFDNPLVVADYASAAENVGLWNSERIVFEKYIPKSSKIIEFGCGAGRISLGLSALKTHLSTPQFSDSTGSCKFPSPRKGGALLGKFAGY